MVSTRAMPFFCRRNITSTKRNRAVFVSCAKSSETTSTAKSNRCSLKYVMRQIAELEVKANTLCTYSLPRGDVIKDGHLISYLDQFGT